MPNWKKVVMSGSNISALNNDLNYTTLTLGSTAGTALAGNTTTITSGQSEAIETNSAKTGITSGQSTAIAQNSAKTGITSGQSTAIAQNSAKTGITSAQSEAIETNSAKTGITSGQSTAIAQNTSGVTTNANTIAGLNNLFLGTTSTTALRGDTTASIAANTSNIATNTSNISTNTSNISGKAASGANNDITSITGLTTPLAVDQGGTGVATLDGIGLSEFDNDENFYKAGESIKIANGALTTPSLAFQSDQNTGIYSVAADTLGIAAGNSLIATFSTTGLQLTAPLLSSDGTSTAPSIAFSADTNTGFYRSGDDELSIAIGGSQIGYFNSNGLQVTVSGQTSQFSGHLQAHCLGIGGSPSTTSGEIWAYGDVVANKSSDKRLKKKIKNIPNALEKVSKINGVTFEWKKTNDKMKREVHSHEGNDIGVIAQEIEEVLPEIVATRDNGYKAVYYEKLVPLLIEAVKELKAEIDELKKSK